MPVIVQVAKSIEDIDTVFKIRHKIAVKERQLVENRWVDKRLIDRFDTYPTTLSFLASKNGETIGTVRVTLDSKIGLPSDQYVSYRHKIPSYSNVMNCSMFCLSTEHYSKTVSTGLLLMAVYFASSNYVTHILSPIEKKFSSLLYSIGFEDIGDVYIDNLTGLEMQPLILDMRKVNDFFLHFIHKNRMQDFIQYYERWFFEAGENIISAGDKGEEVFIIVQGEAEVKLKDGKTIGVLKEGEIFGELALLTDDIRSADVFAKTELQVMVLSKTVFREHLINNPKKVLSLLKLMGERTKSLISQLTKTE
jgi:N-acyl-L-homoserine lactone synthetase